MWPFILRASETGFGCRCVIFCFCWRQRRWVFSFQGFPGRCSLEEFLIQGGWPCLTVKDKVWKLLLGVSYSFFTQKHPPWFFPCRFFLTGFFFGWS